MDYSAVRTFWVNANSAIYNWQWKDQIPMIDAEAKRAIEELRSDAAQDIADINGNIQNLWSDVEELSRRMKRVESLLQKLTPHN